MWHPNTSGTASYQENGPNLDGALYGAKIALWELDATAEQIVFSPSISQLAPALSAAKVPLSQLLQLTSSSNQFLFLQCFNGSLADNDLLRLRACDLRILSLSGEFRLRFVGRLKPGGNGNKVYQGMVFRNDHWLTNTDANSELQYLARLLADSPVPSLITDKNGVVQQMNEACEKLFMLGQRESHAALGKYSLLLDKQLINQAELASTLNDVYQNAHSRALELHYSLEKLHQNRFVQDRALSVMASFLPITNSKREIEYVLLQLQDLSREKRAQAALQESESSYKAFIANSSEAIWCYEMVPSIDVGGTLEDQVKAIAKNAKLIEANKVLVRMLGADKVEEILGAGLVDSGSANYLFDLDKFVTDNYQMVDHDIVREDVRGKQFYFQISCTGIVDEGKLVRVWGTTKDITTRRRFEDKLRHQSLHDALTGLPNREKLYADMTQCFNERHPEQISALMLIDLDRFKEINDTLGHNVGDRLLQMVGPRIANEMAEVPGTVARLGGDEFAVFLPRIRSTHQAVVFGHRILDALAQEFDLDGFCTQMSASIGIAIAPHQANDFHALMRYADIAMYHAKSEMLGLSIYSTQYDSHSPKRLAMMSELGRAIRENQLCLYYQPKVILDEQRCYGFEALIRWIHPELGFVPPNDFIPIAEFTSLIHPLTAWVLENSIQQCREWYRQGLSLSVAVNLSARNLMDENIPKLVERLLAKYELPASRLELEITESSIMADPNRALRILEQLHELGVHLSIDDFGTGYSSLAYLKRLPVQTLKIDNSFVRNMLDDLQDELIVNSTIHLAHNLGLTVVAEGVETDALLEKLHAMGCDEAQGYFIARPMTVENANQWLNESGWLKLAVQ